jgi:hypothetical protein
MGAEVLVAHVVIAWATDTAVLLSVTTTYSIIISNTISNAPLSHRMSLTSHQCPMSRWV